MAQDKFIVRNIPIDIFKDHQTGQFIVHSPVLDLSSCGKTSAQALKSFNEAVQLFLSELERMGTMDDVLPELGWQKVKRPGFGWIPPEIIRHKKVAIRMPAYA